MLVECDVTDPFRRLPKVDACLGWDESNADPIYQQVMPAEYLAIFRE